MIQNNQWDLEKLLKEALDRHLHHSKRHTPTHLDESIRYSLLSPGKRIRPRLLMATAQMLDLTPEATLPAALALEMIHCFTLIHDDLPCMDNDDFRRGMPSNHKKFGESLALLAGDSLIPVAIEVFLESSVETTRLFAGLKTFLWAMGPRGVIGGQAAESLLHSQSSLHQLEEMHSMKTGALFAASLLIPKEFAGISDASTEGKAIHSYAHALGLGFQAADDLEDAPLDPKLGRNEPTSILYFLPKNEVKKRTLDQLMQSTAEIQKIWGKQGLPLKEIADEVIQKVEATPS